MPQHSSIVFVSPTVGGAKPATAVLPLPPPLALSPIFATSERLELPVARATGGVPSH